MGARSPSVPGQPGSVDVALAGRIEQRAVERVRARRGVLGRVLARRFRRHQRGHRGTDPHGVQVGGGGGRRQAGEARGTGGLATVYVDGAALPVDAAYGGPLEHGHPVLNLYVFAVSPISVQIVIKAILVKEPAGSPYGYAFDADIPRIQTTPGNDDASIINFDVKVGAKTTVRVRRHGRTRKVTEYLSYVPRRCPAGGFRWGGDFAFESGETSSATATTPCPKG